MCVHSILIIMYSLFNKKEDKKACKVKNLWPLRRADHSFRGVIPGVPLIVFDLETSKEAEFAKFGL